MRRRFTDKTQPFLDGETFLCHSSQNVYARYTYTEEDHTRAQQIKETLKKDVYRSSSDVTIDYDPNVAGYVVINVASTRAIAVKFIRQHLPRNAILRANAIWIDTPLKQPLTEGEKARLQSVEAFERFETLGNGSFCIKTQRPIDVHESSLVDKRRQLQIKLLAYSIHIPYKQVQWRRCCYHTSIVVTTILIAIPILLSTYIFLF
jgi:hypothetical protein